MKFKFNFFLIFCVIISIFAYEDLSEISEDTTENNNSRELRDQRQDWYSIAYQNQRQQQWIPQTEQTTFDEIQPKRRRLRKRKRKPSTTTTTNFELLEDSNESATTPITIQQQRKRIQQQQQQRPQRLDQIIEETWVNNMKDEEINQKPYIRRKIIPNYNEEQHEYIRDPFTALQEAEEKQKIKKTEEEETTTTTTKSTDLKTLLKQTNGELSLSEILQQKNLSLTELLKGNQKVIEAIKNEPETTKNNYKRLPPSKRKNLFNRNNNFEQNTEETILTSRELLEAQRKRLAILHKHKENKIYADLKKFDVQSVGGESTTEKKRIFVPSHPKYYTSIDYNNNKPTEFDKSLIITEEYDFVQITTPNSPIITTTTTSEIVKKLLFKPKLPMTSAKLHKLLTTTTENYPKPIKIDVNEIFGFNKFVTNQTIKNQERDTPFKIDLNQMLHQQQTTKNIELTTINPEKLKYVTAKEEIMEILKDPQSRLNLSKILIKRNMTVDELVEQRERGSSQLHLADIFHNKTKEPEPLLDESLIIGHIQLPLFNEQEKQRQEKSLTYPINNPITEVTKIEIKPLPITKTDDRTKELYRVTSFPTYKIESDKSLLETKQIWKQLYSDFDQNNQIDRFEDEEIDNKLNSEQSNDRLNIDDLFNENETEENDDDDDGAFFSLPSGVKSAIIASTIIIGSSLIVFLTILFIFKWTQKERQRRRLIYNSSFNGCSSSKIKSPILNTLQQKRSLRSFVNETLGRKKNYYKSHMQSMTDSIWDNTNDKKNSYLH